MTLDNTGTVHRAFNDTLEPLTAKVGSTTVGFGDATVLRGATRTVTATWHSPPLFCLCRLSVSAPNPDGHTSTRSVTVVILLVYRAAAVLVALALCLTAALLLRRLHRRGLAAALEAGRREGRQGQPALAAVTEATADTPADAHVGPRRRPFSALWTLRRTSAGAAPPSAPTPPPTAS
ncbi:hypothetical protein P3T36_006734 [Kitasatospora sp. MAP12-15]|uniref:hypothetical protein n=1 Tax=unclassified Kitasatospora TaxID=2633591 RepID=UPI00247485C3|nr:hypothetical protein [Kitasatospora sp. MAP12-44]MDH6111554.1 hypothetical protein [Kitasatospora sp. MAP12-44]